MLINRPRDSWLCVLNVNQMCVCTSMLWCVCVCVKWPRYLTVQGVMERKLKKDCVHMCLSVFPYNLWVAAGCWCFERQTAICLLHLSTSLTYKTKTNTLWNTQSQKTGTSTTRKENGGHESMSQSGKENHLYHLKCDLKQLIRHDVHEILQTPWHTLSLVLPMNNLLIHFWACHNNSSIIHPYCPCLIYVVSLCI